MFDGSELIGVLVIALVKDLTWVSAILLQGLHLHHCIVLLLNLLLVWAHHLLLRLLWESGYSWLPWSSRLIIDLLSISVKSGVSSLSDVCCLDLKVTRYLKISWSLSTGALGKRKVLRIEGIWFIYDLVNDSTTTTWTGTWIIKENYFCKWGTTKS